ncbi:MAG: ABC transporter permease subunit [Bacteriovoracaceae bacterium]|jgi:microcin C transport system permease protein|nr:ABC transporter permease subunit [Bacteriovoracaceae bacterium]
MTTYFLRRFALIIPTFIGVTILVFFITRLVPGGPVERMISQANQMQAESGMSAGSGPEMANALSATQIQELKEYYGFDKPIISSYFSWLGKVLTGDLGNSTRYGDSVLSMIMERMPISTYYGLMSLLLTYLICIPLGVIKAIKHLTHFDNITSIIVFIGYAVPGYVVGIALLIFLGSQLGWFPLGGFVSEGFEELSFFGKVFDILYHSVLPLSAYMAGSFAVLTFLMKNSLMDNLAADYVRLAMAKGLPFKKAVLRHAMRNSLIPIATSFGNNISLIITGSFLIEKIFNIDGFGLLGYESLVERDYPVVMGILVISSLLFLVGNILSDICVAMVDPRVKFK